MLADIIVGRASNGLDRGRDDLHRHATFGCSFRSRMKRLLKFLRLR